MHEKMHNREVMFVCPHITRHSKIPVILYPVQNSLPTSNEFKENL
jgi:hypothetical protein